MPFRHLIAALIMLAAAMWSSQALAQGSPGSAPDLDSARQALEQGAFGRAADLAQRILNDKRIDDAKRLEAHLIAGEALIGIGRAAEVARGIEEIEQAARAGSDRRGLARVLLLQGTAEYRAGRLDTSRRYLEAARDLSGAIGDARLETRALLNLALVMATDRSSEAQAMLREAAARAESAGDHETRAAAWLNLARLQQGSAAATELFVSIQSASDAAQRLPDSYGKVRLLSGIGELALRLARDRSMDAAILSIAGTALREADSISRKNGDTRSRSFALGFLAELEGLTGKRQQALALNQQAILLAHRAGAPEALYRWYWQRGRLIAQAGGRDQAIDAYRRAVRYLSDVRVDADAGAASVGAGFREIFGPMYLELADLLLQQSAATKVPARRRDLLLEARNVIESSKAAELQDYFQDSCVAAQQARVAGLDQLAPGTAVLYPVLLRDRVELLLSFHSGIVQITVPVPAAKVVEEVRAFRELLEKRTTRQYLAPARRLYDMLIRPVEALLIKARVDTIVMIPDGPLRTIPLAALHDGKAFLIERFALAVTPGLTLTDPRPFPKSGLRALIGGITESVQGFSALPNVAGELQSIQSVFEGQVLQDSSYRISRIEDELLRLPYSLVHIASHGQFDSDPKKTFLLAYDGKVSMDLLEKLIAPTRLREQAIELLALSACQTAAGDDRAALGLAGVAIKAGARSALASLWFINDESSATLVGEFYRKLQTAGATKASALQAAQRTLMADGRYSHPAYWAPFLLIGNWL